MAHCTYNQLFFLAEFQEKSSDQITAIIAEADRQVDAYLSASGVGTGTTDAATSASLALSRALLLELEYQVGMTNKNDHDFSPPADISNRIKDLRSEAFQILDNYIAIQSSLATPRRTRLMRVN